MTNHSTYTKPEAYVTLVATDSYVQGAIVLAYSIRNLGTKKLLICLVTEDLSKDSVTHLHKVFDHVLPIEKLDTFDEKHLKLLGRPELGLTVTKIHIWSLTWLETVLFLDADTLVMKSLDHLFDKYRNTTFAACPDPGWPDCFNSGVFVCKPNFETYNDLLTLMLTQGSFDGGDQGLLNSYFNGWSQSATQRMPFIYNVTPNVVYSYAPAFEKNSEDIAVMHFIGKDKPWNQEEIAPKEPEVDDSTPTYTKLMPALRDRIEDSEDNEDSKSNMKDYVQKWWDVYRDSIQTMSCTTDSWAPQGGDYTKQSSIPQEASQPEKEEIRHTEGAENTTNVSYALGGDAGHQTTTLPFRNEGEAVNYDRPILPRETLSDLAHRQMLTPAHQQASDENKPFPLFEAFREPRKPSNSQQDPEPTMPQIQEDIPMESEDKKGPVESGANNVEEAQKPPLSINKHNEMVSIAKEVFPEIDGGMWVPVPITIYNDKEMEEPDATPQLEVDTLLSNSSIHITPGVTWSAKLTCISSEPQKTPAGKYSTTYTLVWENEASANPSLINTPYFAEKTPPAEPPLSPDNSRPPSRYETPDHHRTPSESSRSPAQVPSSQNESFMSHSVAKNVSSKPVELLTNHNLIQPGKTASYSGTEEANAQHGSSIYNERDLAPQDVTSLPQIIQTPSTPEKNTVPRYVPINYDLPVHNDNEFGSYRVQWDQPELRGWKPPRVQSQTPKPRYKDSEDPHDKRLRRKSLNLSNITYQSAPVSAASSPLRTLPQFINSELASSIPTKPSSKLKPSTEKLPNLSKNATKT